MPDDTTGDGIEQSVRRSAGARLVSWVVALVVVVVVLVLFLHVVAPAIGPDEQSPSGHAQSACIACHIVSVGAGAEQ